MADPRFFTVAGPFALSELARSTGATLRSCPDPDRLMRDVAPLETAGPDAVSFLDNPKYLSAFERSRAGAAFVSPAMAARAPAGMALLVSEQPYRAYALAAQAFYPPTPVTAGIHPTAVVAPDAVLQDGVELGPYVVVGARAEIGAGTVIGPSTVVGPGVILGEQCRIAAHVSLSHCRIGNRVVLYPGVRIGQDGFGFAPSPKGHVKVPQLGCVLVGDDVEIGANTCIDRGAGPDTVIGAGTIIDNLVQMGHNVVVGRACVLVSQTGISGSTRLGDFVMVGGQTGIAGHLTIGPGAQLAAQSGVMRDVAPGEKVGGSPALPFTTFMRLNALLSKMAAKKG